MARQAQLTQLNAEEQRLARTLAQITGDTPTVSGWVELDALRRNIPANAVYVDLVRMGIYDFKKDVVSPPHYLAWIIPTNGDIQLRDLGEAKLIEAALEKNSGVVGKRQRSKRNAKVRRRSASGETVELGIAVCCRVGPQTAPAAPRQQKATHPLARWCSVALALGRSASGRRQTFARTMLHP